ncbi:MAG: hypothetical protein OIN88_14960 [Candidatus Methanoperedens sp.]|nr:hypothetical protein [Candidatus Methanoperedens sp.]
MEEYKLRILDMKKEERPRERLVKNGPSALSDSELLAIILRTGTKQENVINLSQRILSEYNLKQLSTTSLDQLTRIHGIKESKAAQIAACFEIARRLESFIEEEKPKINSPEDVYRRIYPRMREQKKENFIELCLDPSPSREDIEITRKLVETGKIIGINVLDHVIIGDGRHFSMKEAGHI